MKPKPLSSVSEDSSQPTVAQPPNKLLKDFGIGFSLGMVPVFALLSISIWTTHTPWTQVQPIELAAAITIPLICGLFAAIFREKFTAVLSNILEALPL